MSIVERLEKKLAEEFLRVEENEALSPDEKVGKIIKVTCIGCASVAATPVPVADFFILTPVQAYMGYKIARVRGVPVSRQDAIAVAKEILGVVGLGLLAREIAAGALKFIPIWGSVANVPIVFGLTYAIGRVMDYYFTEKAAGRSAAKEMMKKIFRDSKIFGESAGETYAKAQSTLSEKESEITQAFLAAKDRFVKDARDAFTDVYKKFADTIKETPLPETKKKIKPVKKPKAKPAKKAPRARKKPAAPKKKPGKK